MADLGRKASGTTLEGGLKVGPGFDANVSDTFNRTVLMRTVINEGGSRSIPLVLSYQNQVGSLIDPSLGR